MKKFFLILFACFARSELTRAVNVAPAAPSQISAINVAFDAKQEWSTLRFGVYPNEVGLQVFDRPAAEAIVSAFNSVGTQLAEAFRGLPGYIGHPDDAKWLKRNPGARAEAVARIKEMRVTDEGLQFRTAYNADGTRLLQGDAPAYEAYSPNWGMVPITYQGRPAFRPVELYSIGFTNQPNIPGTFIGLNEALPAATAPNMNLKEILLKLLAVAGLTVPADASDDQIAEAATKAETAVKAAMESAGSVPALNTKVTELTGSVTTLQGQLTTAQNEATTQRQAAATERAARVASVLTAAVNEGRITAAQRPEWEGKFSAQGASFDTVAADLAKVTKAVNTQSKANVGARRGVATSPEAKQRIAAVNEAISAKMKAANCDRTTAYVALQKEKPELFTTTNA